MQFIINQDPPNIEKIKARFNIEGKPVIFSYGDKIYNPSNVEISMDLLIHEGVHQRRQGNDVEGWWTQYLEDDGFRLLEELEAYSRQFIEFCTNAKDRNSRARFLHRIASDLSSEIYGSIITYSNASKIIRSETKKFIK